MGFQLCGLASILRHKDLAKQCYKELHHQRCHASLAQQSLARSLLKWCLSCFCMQLKRGMCKNTAVVVDDDQVMPGLLSSLLSGFGFGGGQ